MSELSFLKNRVILFAIMVLVVLFLVTLAIEKTKLMFNTVVPMIRGEVNMKDFVITTTKEGAPIVINKTENEEGDQLRSYGIVHSHFNDIVSTFSDNNSVVVEIGSHFGYNTIRLAKNLRYGGKVYAFEANGKIYSALRKSLILNDLDNVVVMKNIAISDHIGFCDVPDCTSTKKLPDGSHTKPKIFSAKCCTIDEELINEDRPVDLIVADVHGIEIPILISCENIIERSPNIVIIFTFDNENPDPRTKTEFTNLENKGMKFFISDKKNKYTQMTSIDELMEKKEVTLIVTRRNLI